MQRKSEVAWALIFVAAGFLIGHYPMLLSGFDRMEAELGDTRFIYYLLEHSWRWATRVPLHAELWSPPFFFPQKEIGAYSEILLGSAPPYWLFRALGFEMAGAAQGWLLSTSALNCLSMFVFLRWLLRLQPLPATIGAVLFSFAGVRLAQAGHFQLYPHYWTILALIALGGAVRCSGAARLFCAAAVAPCVALQLWAGFYLGWFAALAGVLALAWTAILPSLRARGVVLLKQLWLPLLSGVLVAGAIAWPMAVHYLGARKVIGGRELAHAMVMVPPLEAWLYAGGSNLVYGKWAAQPMFEALPYEHEQQLALGLVTFVIAIIGCWSGRGRPEVRLASLVGLSLVILSLRFGDQSLWTLVYAYVPAANAIRAVARLVVLVLIPVSMGVAVALDRVPQLSKVVLLGGLVLLEQVRGLSSFDKQTNDAVVARIVEEVSRNSCKVFFYSPEGSALPSPHWQYQVDAMWAQLEAAIPTINGYSGNEPRGWGLTFSGISSPAHESSVRARLMNWVESRNLSRADVCWIRAKPIAQRSAKWLPLVSVR